MPILNGDACCNCPVVRTNPSSFYALRANTSDGADKWRLATDAVLSGNSVICNGDQSLLHYHPPANDFILANTTTGVVELKFGQGISPGTKQFWHIDDWVVFRDSGTHVYDAYDFNGDLLWTKTLSASANAYMQGFYGRQFMWIDSGTLYYKSKDGTEGTWTRTAGGLYGRLTTTSGYYHLDGGVDAFGQGTDPVLRLYTPTLELEYDCMPSDLDSFFATIYGPYPIGSDGIAFAFEAQDDDFAVLPRWVVVTAVGTTVNRYEFVTGTFPGAHSSPVGGESAMFFIDGSTFIHWDTPNWIEHYSGTTRTWRHSTASYFNGKTQPTAVAADATTTVMFLDTGANLCSIHDNSDGSATVIATADVSYSQGFADSLYVRTPSMYLVRST